MKNKKILIPIIAGVAVLIAVITVICIVTSNKKEAYRIIKVYEIEGEATVSRDGMGQVEAYANMILKSGDTVILESGTMTLKLDEDKYIYMEEGAELVLKAKGTAKNSKTTITLKKGAITNELQNKLNDESSYELNTPNSTMSVRGTIYRAEVYENEDGNLHTRVTVFEGKVETQLVLEDGTKEKPVVVTDKTEVIIYQDENTTDYLTDVTPIDVSTLPPEAINTIQTIIKNGTKLDIDVEAPDETQSEENTNDSGDTGKMAWIVKSSKETDEDGEVTEIFSNEYKDGVFKSTLIRNELISNILEIKTENNTVKEIVSYTTMEGKEDTESTCHTYFTLDAENNLLTINAGSSQMYIVERDTTYAYTFDADGKLATILNKETDYDVSSGERVEYNKWDDVEYSYEYGDNSYTLKIKQIDSEDNTYELDTVTIPYDKSQNITVVTTYHMNDGTSITADYEWYFKDSNTLGTKPCSKKETTYNSAGYILTETAYFDTGEVFHYFTYDEATRTTTFCDIKDRLVAKYTYDENGRIVHTLYYGYSGSTSPEMDATISYDDNGNISKCDYTYSNGGHYIVEFEWMQVPEIIVNTLILSDDKLHFIDASSDSTVTPTMFDRTLYDIYEKTAIFGE